jgi:hypothetical protein
MPDSDRRLLNAGQSRLDAKHASPHANRRRGANRRGFIGLACFAAVAALIFVLIRSSGASVPDMPASFGPGNDCYYVTTPAEAANLEKQGKCPQGDVSAQAPQSWVTSYYPFYNSSWYKSTIVPQSAQADYSGYMSSFGAANATEIAQQAPAAKYLDSNGNVVTGSDAGVSGDGTSIGGHDGGSGGGGGDGGGGDGGGGHGGGGE